MIARFRAWLTARLAWLDVDDPTDSPEYGDSDLDRPHALDGSCELCGGCAGCCRAYGHEGPWDADDLPSTADPGVVTDPKNPDGGA